MISSRMLPRQITSSLRAPAELSSLHSSDCSLLVLSFRSSPFRISNLEPLFAKHPGGGVRVCVATLLPWQVLVISMIHLRSSEVVARCGLDFLRRGIFSGN